MTGRVQGSAYQFVVTALDNGYPVREGTTSVRINVVPTEQNVLEFSDLSYIARIAESELTGYRILSVKVKSARQPIRYEFVTGNLPSSDPRGMFRLDSATGSIHLEGKLDYETTPEHTLMIKASSPDSDVKPAYTVLKVIVKNVNDNPPVFDSKVYNITVPENIPINTKVLELVAHDADDPKGTHLQYHILKSSATAEDLASFSLNKDTGVLQTSGRLNTERKSSYLLRVRVYDHKRTDVRRFYDSAIVYIAVSDTNDSPPVFLPGQRRFTVREDHAVGEKVASVLAQDADENPMIRYYFEKGNELGMFKIDERSGEIKLIAPLDRESTSRYGLTVIAYDGVFVATVDVEIIVTDINDNSPVCNRAFYQVAITEGMQGSPVVARVTARDPDSSDELTYSLQGEGFNNFLVNDRTGKVQIGKTGPHIFTVSSKVPCL